jgi:hypothetical protein
MKTMSEAVREMQFDSSLPRYRKARSVKRKKLGELLYRDLANCRTVIWAACSIRKRRLVAPSACACVSRSYWRQVLSRGPVPERIQLAQIVHE